MKVGLFIPCYINQLYPQVGIATVEVLEKLNVEIVYPTGQTCCGQPMANSGYENESVGACNNFVQNFKEFDYIVTPSGSCAYHVKKHYNILEQTPEVVKVRDNVYELCDFIVNVLKIKDLGASFPAKVGVHKSCHGLRGLRLGSCSEVVGPYFSSIDDLLKEVKGVELMELKRKDECCGFGGTFAVTEEAVSVKMGKRQNSRPFRQRCGSYYRNRHLLLNAFGRTGKQKQTALKNTPRSGDFEQSVCS